MKADVKSPLRKKGQEPKDLRDYVSRLDLRAQNDIDEMLLSKLYQKLFHGGRRELAEFLGMDVDAAIATQTAKESK